MRRHHGETLTIPANPELLPVYAGSHHPAKNDTEHSGDESVGSSSCFSSPDVPNDCDAPETEKPSAPSKKATSSSLASSCGELPPGMLLEDFLEPPKRRSVRNTEALYWQNLLRSMNRTSAIEATIRACTQKIRRSTLMRMMPSLPLRNRKSYSKGSTKMKLTSRILALRAAAAKSSIDGCRGPCKPCLSSTCARRRLSWKQPSIL